MSEVEALLSVDRGQIPQGTMAFFPRDQEAPIRRLRASLAVLRPPPILGAKVGGRLSAAFKRPRLALFGKCAGGLLKVLGQIKL